MKWTGDTIVIHTSIFRILNFGYLYVWQLVSVKFWRNFIIFLRMLRNFFNHFRCLRLVLTSWKNVDRKIVYFYICLMKISNTKFVNFEIFNVFWRALKLPKKCFSDYCWVKKKSESLDLFQILHNNLFLQKEVSLRTRYQ